MELPADVTWAELAEVVGPIERSDMDEGNLLVKNELWSEVRQYCGRVTDFFGVFQGSGTQRRLIK